LMPNVLLAETGQIPQFSMTLNSSLSRYFKIILKFNNSMIVNSGYVSVTGLQTCAYLHVDNTNMQGIVLYDQIKFYY
jgi:hypothetical protein